MPKLLASLAVTVAALSILGAATAESREAFPLGPQKSDGPVIVRAAFHLRDINSIDEETETFEFEAVLTLSWRDARQVFDPSIEGVDEKIFQGAYQFNEVFNGWFPQVVLVNESGLFEVQGVVLRVRPDGTMTLIQTLNAIAKTDLDLRRYPFDRQRMEAVFEVLGFDRSEIVFQLETSAPDGSVSRDPAMSVPQWEVTRVRGTTRDRSVPYAGSTGTASTFVVSLDLARHPFFMLRLVVLPLVLMVMLSWSVFWMERSSLGDRISVSFIGILTAVAYQLVVSEILPQISYFTLINAIINLSLIFMCSTVLINLVVGAMDKRGRIATGDLIDRRCRLIFPLSYFGLILVILAIAFLLVPETRFGS